MNRQWVLSLAVLSVYFLKLANLYSTIPSSLSRAPLLDGQGCIINSQLIQLKGPQHPYNASLQWDNTRKQYILIFREDLKGKDFSVPRGARLGIALLSKRFEQVGDCQYPIFQQFGPFVEDPRLFYTNGALYTLYYVYPPGKSVSPCFVRLDEKTFQPQATYLASSGAMPQKNWIPLIDEAIVQEKIPVITRLFPLTLTSFVRGVDGCMSPSSEETSDIISISQPSHWKWGKISGGTHAIRLKSGYYLAFFHSWFLTSAKKRLYVMGACLLDKNYPYTPKKLSPYPIIWSDIYENKVNGLRGPVFSRRWARNLDRVIFPTGLVVKRLKNEKEVAIVTCGENDNSIRVLTFDLRKLLSSLIPTRE